VLARIFIVVGSLVVAALFAALIAPYFVDWTDFRHDFENQASRIIGKKVVVHGEVDARLLPFPSVTMTDVRVGENADGEAIVSAKSFSMESELAPFLSGEALIYNMRIDQPKLTLKLGQDGALDWVKTGNPQIPASSVVLENVTITNGQVDFIDEQTQRTRHLSNLDLALSAKTLAGPWKASGKGALDGEGGDFSLTTSMPDKDQIFLKLKLLPKAPSIVAEMDGAISLKDLRPQYAGSFKIRQKFRTENDDTAAESDATTAAAPRISGDFQLTNDRVRIDKYQFSMGPSDDPYTVTGEATIDAGLKPEFLLTATGQQVDMSRFGGDGGEGEGASLPLKDRLRAFLALVSDIPVPQMPGRAEISLPALIADDTVIRNIHLKTRPVGDGWAIDEAEAELPGRTTLSAKGKLTLAEAQGFEGQLLVASKQPSGFAEWVTGKAPEAIRKLKTAGFSANVSLTPDLQRFENLEIVFGGAQLRGRLEHQMDDGDQPALSTELSGNDFDLDTMMALGGLLTGEPNIGSLLSHRIGARFKFDHFTGFGLEAGKVDASLSLSDGALTDARATIGDFYGARLGFEGGFDKLAQKPTGAARITVKSDDPSRLLQLIADKLPQHPALKRLAANASYYEGADILLDLTLGKGDWPIEANLSGIAHGSKMSAKLAAQTLDLANSGGLTLDAEIENPDAWVMLGQAGLTTLPIDADQDGLLTLKIDQPDEADTQLDLAFKSGTTDFKVSGQARLDMAHFLDGSYALSLESGDIAPYLAMTGYGAPRLAEGLPLTLNTNIYAEQGAIAFEGVNGKADGDAFSGEASLDRTASDAMLRGAISIDAMDLAWLSENVFGPVAAPLGGFSDQTMSAKAGPPIKADIAVTAKSFNIGPLATIVDFSTRLAMEPGRLSLSGGAGKLLGGKLTAEADLGNTEGSGYFRAHVDVKDASLHTGFWSVKDAPAASAKADLALTIDATGASPKALLQGATGSGMLKLQDLRINGVNGAALPPILAKADAIQGELSDAALQPIVANALFDGALTLPRFDIPFSITGDKLRVDKVVGDAKGVHLDGQALVSLIDGRLDSELDLTYSPGEEKQSGADPIVRLTFAGPFARPTRVLDMTQMSNFLSLRKFEQERRRVEILQAKLEEKQRLRRETMLWKTRYAERERLRQLAIDNARLMKQAEEKLHEMAVEEERQRAEARDRQQDLNAEPAPAPVQ